MGFDRLIKKIKETGNPSVVDASAVNSFFSFSLCSILLDRYTTNTIICSLSIYPLLDIWDVSTFSRSHVNSFLQSKYLGVELVDHRVNEV